MGPDPGNRNWCDYWASEGGFVTHFGMSWARAAVWRSVLRAEATLAVEMSEV